MHEPSDREPSQPAGQLLARLHLSGIETPIVTQITRRTERGMTVEQALPFLQLRTEVWSEAQPPSRIESVSVVVYDGMPRLVLDLAYDEAPDHRRVAPQALPEPRRAHAGVVRSRERMTLGYGQRVDDTVSYERDSLQLTAANAQGSPKPRPDATQSFRTHAGPQADNHEEAAKRPLPPEVANMQLSSMEKDLLQPRDWVFHARLAWKRSQPHVRRAADKALELAKLVAARGAPLLRRAALKVASYDSRAWQRASRRRLYSGRSTDSASPTLPSQS
jgi:hypothetical protein